MFRLIPGDPTSALIDPTFPATLRAEILHRFGLDRPLHEQYLSFLSHAVRGDFGYSFYYSQPVKSIIGDMVINTVLLALATFVLTYQLGIAGGVLLAWKRGNLGSTPVA